MCVKTFWRSYKRIKVQGAKGRKGGGGWLWKFFRGRTSWWTVWTCQPSLPIVDICKVCRFAIQINFVEIAFKCCSWIVRSMFSFICKIRTSPYLESLSKSMRQSIPWPAWINSRLLSWKASFFSSCKISTFFATFF